MKCGLLLPSLARSPSPAGALSQTVGIYHTERDGVSLIYSVTADTGPPVRVDTLSRWSDQAVGC